MFLNVPLSSFIFVLDDKWKDVVTLRQEFQKYVERGGEGKPDMNFVQAAEFLQKHDKTRIAQQIKDELKDIGILMKYSIQPPLITC